MCKMPHCHLSLFLDIGEEWTLVVDLKREDAVLVWECEGCAEDGAVECGADRGEGEAVEGGEHAEFELPGVGWGWGEGGVVRVCVEREFNVECL